MAKKLKLSPIATEQMYRVRHRLRLESRDYLWTLRIAFARSLQTNIKSIELKPPINPDVTTSDKRFEIEVATLEQKDGVIFKALLQQF